MYRYCMLAIILAGVGFYYPYEQPPEPYGYVGGVRSQRYQEDVQLYLKQQAWDKWEESIQTPPAAPIVVRPLPREERYETYFHVD